MERTEVRSWGVGGRAAWGLEARVVREVCADEVVLFLDSRIVGCVAAVGYLGIVVIVGPFGLSLCQL